MADLPRCLDCDGLLWQAGKDKAVCLIGCLKEWGLVWEAKAVEYETA